MTEKMDLLGRLELQVVRDPSTGVRKVVFRNQRGQLLDPADNPELMATFGAGGVSQADLSSALATKANASSLAAKVDTAALTAAIATQNASDKTIFAKRRNALYGPVTVVDGDSITIGGVSSNLNSLNQDRNGTWTQQMAALSMGRMRLAFNAALSGQNSAGMLSRFDTYVAPYTPDVVIATIGTNDVGQGVSQATWLANLLAYKQKCDAIGARLQLGEVWPTDDPLLVGGVARGAVGRSWNKALRTFCRQNDLQPPIPWTMLADPATGGWPSTWTSDKIHPNSVGTPLIGQFGWEYLKSLYGQSELVRPSVNGEDSSTNGFLLTTTGTPITAPNSVTATATTGTGTLPAGTYSYKMTATGYFGETLPSGVATATLSAAGNIAVANANGNPAGNQGFAIYRQNPANGLFQLIGTVAAGTYSFTDDGTATLGTATPPPTNQAIQPLGWSAGGGQPFKPGYGLMTAESSFARGNKFRITPSRGGVSGNADNLELAKNSVVAGQVYEASVLVQGDGNLKPNFGIRLYSDNFASQTGNVLKIASDPLLPGKVYLYTLRFTIPTGVTSVKFFAEAVASTSGWIDIAEIGLQRIS